MYQIYFILEWHCTCFGRSFRPLPAVQDCTYSCQTDTAVCLLILEWHSTCFGWSFRPSSGVQDCTYSNRHLSNRYCCLLAYFGMTLYMFRTIFPSIISSSRLYIQLSNRYCCMFASKQTEASRQQYLFDSCMYSLELLMMDGKIVRNMYSVIPK